MPGPGTPSAAGARYDAPHDAQPPTDPRDGPDGPDGAAAGGAALTELLRAHAAGDADALGRLMPRVYEELQRIARARLRRERADHTLCTAEVVHEAFLDLLPPGRVDWQSRAHFFAVASRAMRNVLVDYAVRRGTVKRGAGARALPLDDLLAEQVAAAERPLDDLIALNDALARLEALDQRRARVVECRFFGGMSLDETAEALGSSPATVSRDWAFARAWLHRELAGEGASEDGGGGSS
jgi:RNA polymerase sigma-70 factor, ECF subfamily